MSIMGNSIWWEKILSCVRERRLPWMIKVILDKHTTNLNNLIRHGTTDIFNHVYFDTITSCNRRCYYCPNAVYDRGLIKNEKLMDETLFRKIIDDLDNSILLSVFVETAIFGSLLSIVVSRLNGIRTRLPTLRLRLEVPSEGPFSLLERRSIFAARR